MERIQLGQKIVKWRGTSVLHGITLTFELNPHEPEVINFGFELRHENESPFITRNMFKFVRALQQATSISLDELSFGFSFGDSSVGDLQFGMPSDLVEYAIEISETLVDIFQKLKLNIRFPDGYEGRDITSSRIIQAIFKHGMIRGLLDYPDTTGNGYVLVEPKSFSEFNKRFEDGIKAGEDLYLRMQPDQPQFELLGTTFHLGQRIVVLSILEVGLPSEEAITTEEGGTALKVPIQFDPKKSYTVYERWCSDEDRENYLGGITETP